MKLLRVGNPGLERPAVLDATGTIRDLSAIVPDIDGNAIQAESLERLRAVDPQSLPVVEGTPRIGPCINRIGKIVCVGLNYSDHAAESKMAIPTEPVLFMKATSCVCGPNDNIVLPRGSQRTDWEVELAAVIGEHAKYVDAKDALSYVAGYCVINDISERSFQLERGGQWVKGKSADTFGPIGPWLVTRDEFPDPQNLQMWLEVNGHRFQNSSTANMIFTVAHLVSYISQFMSLRPGDIIATGTPPGVGLGQNPPTFLKENDVVRLGVIGLGEQCQTVISSES